MGNRLLPIFLVLASVLVAGIGFTSSLKRHVKTERVCIVLMIVLLIALLIV